MTRFKQEIQFLWTDYDTEGNESVKNEAVTDPKENLR